MTAAVEWHELRRRCVEVHVDEQLFRDKPLVVAQMFFAAIPVRAEFDYSTHAFVYWLVAPNFPPRPLHAPPPRWRAVFTDDRFVGFEPGL